MQVQEKNIKGFNLIELLVVIAIISIISAAAYPNFSSWKKAREVRGAAVKIKSLFTNINSQVQRGLYGFIQVEVTASTTGGEVVVISKGMKLSKLASIFPVLTSSSNDFCIVIMPSRTDVCMILGIW